MPETFKQNVITLAMSILLLIVGAMGGWVMKISNGLTDLKGVSKGNTEGVQEVKKLVSANLVSCQSDTDRIKERLGTIDVKLASINALRDLIEKFEAQMNLQAARLTGHRDTRWHGEAGRELTELRTRLDAFSKTVDYVEGQVKIGKRYTLAMADADNKRHDASVLRLEKQLERLAHSMGMTENSIHMEVQSLRNSFNAILSQKHDHPGGKLILNQD